MAKMIQNEAEDTANSVPVTSMVSPGLDPKDPAAIEAMNNSLRLRGRDVLRAGVMGAAAGSQVGQQAGDPRSAFIQGMAAGMGATDTIFKERRQELQTAADIVPFGSTHPEIVNSNPAYAIFKGIPTKLALQAIQQIGVDAAKIQAESNARMAEKKEDFKYKQMEIGLKGKDPMSLKDQLDLRKNFEGIDAVKQYQVTAPAYEMIINSDPGIGDKVAVIKFAQMLNPTVRVNDATMDSMDASGTLDKFTADAWRKAKTGAILGPDERRKLISEATKIYNQRSRDFHEVASVVREQASAEGFNPAHIVSESPIETVERFDKSGNKVILQKMKDGTFRKVN